MDEAARLWSLAAELWLYLVLDHDPQIEKFYAKNIPRRGTIMPFQKQDLIKKVHFSGDSQELRFENRSKSIIAKVYEIKGHIQRWRQEGGAMAEPLSGEPMGKDVHERLRNTMKNLVKKAMQEEKVVQEAIDKMSKQETIKALDKSCFEVTSLLRRKLAESVLKEPEAIRLA